MAAINRIRCTWNSNVPGGGISTFYLAGTETDVSAFATFFTTLAPLLPAGTNITVPDSGEQLEHTNGHLLGNWVGTGGATILGTGNAVWSNGVGAAIEWRTGEVVGRRLLKGRTFIAPLGQGFASNNGSLNDGNVVTLQGAGATLIAAVDLLIWHRPTKASPTSGAVAPANAVFVPDRVTALRSRRY